MWTLAFLENMSLVEFLIVLAVAFVLFRRSARSVGRAVGSFSASRAVPPEVPPNPEPPLAEYYRALDLQPGASEAQVREAYKELVKIWHPDRYTHDRKLQERAEAKLKEINIAYEKLVSQK